MTSQQYILNFPVLQSHSTDDFVVGGCNKLAVEFVNRWPEWPAHALVLIGETASGKTHLAKIFQEKSGGTLLSGRDLTEKDIPGFSQVVILENADEGVEEAALFHLFNWTRDRGGFLLITARTPPLQWQLALKDLSSRLQSSPLVSLDRPDENILGAAMAKQFSDRQMVIDDRVIGYLLKRIERSFSAVQTVVNRIDTLSLREKSRISVPLAKKILEIRDDSHEAE